MATSQPTPILPPAPAPRRGSKKRLIVLLCGGAAVLVLLLFSLGGRTYRNYRLAAAAAEHFHEQLNRTEYNSIYEEASEDFRRSGTREDFGKVLETVHQKMGVAGKMRPLGFHLHWQSGRTLADADFNTKFTQGQAQETFVWIMQQNQLQLYSYHIDSSNLH